MQGTTGAEHIRVKICGLTNLEDARHAWRAGADMLGFVFVPSSPRCVTPETVAEIVGVLHTEGCPTEMVGLFVDQADDARFADEVRDVVARCGLDRVQWHGPLTPDIAAALGVPVMLAHRVRDQVPWAELLASGADVLLLDSYVKGKLGGTGQTWNWEAIHTGRPPAARIALAGGLNPDNVAEAIRATLPWAVDVSSGVEQRPGTKDIEKVNKFILNAKAQRPPRTQRENTR